MREIVRETIKKVLMPTLDEAGIELSSIPFFTVEVPPEEKFGDYSTNIAMVCSKLLKDQPRKIAEKLVESFSAEELFEKVEIAGPGFINFFIKTSSWLDDFKSIPDDSSDYGSASTKKDGKLLIEFVSANPTGPLHIGHGRGAAVGDVLARLLSKAGVDVTTEYYINDAGLQMENLGRSTLARYKELHGEKVEFPENGYKGDYIMDVAQELKDKDGDKYLGKPDEELIPVFTKHSADSILDDIKNDLKRFRVYFDLWTSEQTFHDAGKVEAVIADLQKSGAIFEEDGALWLDSMKTGDEKNRVVKRANGVVTYLAADIAYHKDKYERGFNTLIDIWGADHHGYIARMKACVNALGQDIGSLKTVLIQLVNLKRGGEIVAMSTRSGTFTTLKEVLDEVGVDAARFFFLTRSYDSHFDFDLDLAKEQSSENPVYYVQYAHARICNIFKTAKESGIKELLPKDVSWESVTSDEELRIIKKCLSFPSVVADSAEALSPHHITHYLSDLAALYHKYYTRHRVVTEDKELTMARLAFGARVRTVLKNALDIIGVSAPEKM